MTEEEIREIEARAWTAPMGRDPELDRLAFEAIPVAAKKLREAERAFRQATGHLDAALGVHALPS